MSYLPAPYESAQQDDLPAALAAGLTVSVAGIVSFITGQDAYHGVRLGLDLLDRPRAEFDDLPADLLVPTVGWAAGVVLMVIGALLLAFRRGRGAVVFGGLVSLATTVISQYAWGFGTREVSVPQWPLYWGGGLVVVLAMLPATRRWIARPDPRAAQANPGVATLWPGT